MTAGRFSKRDLAKEIRGWPRMIVEAAGPAS
jgi:hypothetical protein